MSIQDKVHINEKCYLYKDGTKTIIHLDGKDIDVTDSWAEYNRIINVDTRNNFWFVTYKIGSDRFISYYYDNKRVYTDYIGKGTIITEQNNYLCVFEQETEASYVLDSDGNIKFKADGVIYYYTIIDNNEVALYFDNEYVLVINNEEHRYNWEISHIVVNNKNEICIVGDSHNAAYDLKLNKIRDLEDSEIKEYCKGSYYCRR